MHAAELDTPYELTDATVERFRQDGFVHLRDVLSAETLERYGEDLWDKCGREESNLHGPKPNGS
jgi:hypothetical protein